MKKFLLFLIIAIIIVIIIFVLFFKTKKVQQTFEFPNTVSVENYTTYNVDTFILVGLNKIFSVDTINIKIFPSRKIEAGDISIIAYVIKSPFNEYTYMLFIREGVSPSEIKRIISHELVHIKQMYDGDLLFDSADSYVAYYHNIKYDLTKIPYNDRPFEKDAFDLQNRVYKNINDTLYKRKP